MHLPAESHVARLIGDPENFIETNIVGIYTLQEATHQYCQAMEAENKINPRVDHMSTDEVNITLPHTSESTDAVEYVIIERI